MAKFDPKKADQPKLIDKVLAKLPHLKLFLQNTGIRDTRQKERAIRTVYINNIKPNEYTGEAPLDYGRNQIITSKYTLFNFLPKNLYEQFRRLANFYFLVNIIIMFAIPEPPKSPVVALIPLTMVVVFTAIKQGYEDILRHRTDAQVNKAPVRVLRNGVFSIIQRKDIKCGDIVEVRENSMFPCDLLLLYCETDDRGCFITTANLDGESNLKSRFVPDKLRYISSENDLISLRGVLKFDKPNLELYEFKGKIEINKEEFPLRNENVLLRGSTLRLAQVAYGCAIYTGKDTKLMLNSKFKASKLSCIEKTFNKFMLFFLCLLFLLTLICLIGALIFDDIYNHHWYLKNLESNLFLHHRAVYYIFEALFYATLLSNIIPISMYISIETQRFVGTKFFEWDLQMYDAATDQPAKANNSNINEDLGQVEYLFTDKTGTLTENEMIFKQFYLNGTTYEFKSDSIYKLGFNYPEKIHVSNKEMKRFFECLALCHSVQYDKNAGFMASSPDENCFIRFCEKIGVEFKGDKKQKDMSASIRQVNFMSEELEYELLHTLEFDSNRKRMSVLVRSIANDERLLFTKGAESSVFDICDSKSSVEDCNKSIDQFATQGWRTMALAYKTVSAEEMRSYNEMLTEAYNDLSDDRDQKLSHAYEQIETNLTLIGSTGVEDKLQEKVPSTLQSLRKAGIKIWVLTGDKKETAINISESCKHFWPGMHRFILTDMSNKEEIIEQLKLYKKFQTENEKIKSFGFIIDGKTLGYIFKHDLEKQFRDVCLFCDAVLCCRMSPSQKAMVVKLVKTSKKKPITCAIGDGANDVSMIQEAHIGLGIFGKEGRNAARSADFAFSKFKHIKRALLVHGYLYYTRLSVLALYFFYKNLVFVVCQAYYAPYSAFSVQSLYHGIYLTFYNVFLTAYPILVFGLFEQRTKIKELEKNPYLYRTIRRNRLLSGFEFFKWNFFGLWHSLVAYFSTHFLYSESNHLSPNGLMDGYVEFSSVIAIQVIIIVHLKLFIEWRTMNIFALLGFLLSAIGFVVACLIPNSFISRYPLTTLTEEQSFYWNIYQILSYPSIWLCILVSSVAALIPDMFVKIVENTIRDLSHSEKKERSLEKSAAHIAKCLKERLRKRDSLRQRKNELFRLANEKLCASRKSESSSSSTPRHQDHSSNISSTLWQQFSEIPDKNETCNQPYYSLGSQYNCYAQSPPPNYFSIPERKKTTQF